MASPRVIVTRAEKRGGAPTVPSRWLQRIGAVTGSAAMAAMTARGSRIVQLARNLDRVKTSDVRPVSRPAPRPKVETRPRQLSITQIETLIRDPYAIYARRILDLEPLEAIGKGADAGLRGTLVHEALADFTRNWRGPFDANAEAALLELWRKHFEAIKDFPEVHALWSLRAPRIAAWVANWERERAGHIARKYPEVQGKHVFHTRGGEFLLTGRADRIDLFADGTLGIYDYKTGMPPSAKQVLPFSPQLALEAAMATAGAFEGIEAGHGVSELAWIGVAQIGKDDPLRSAVPDNYTPDTIGAEVMRRLHGLIAAYDDPDKAYVSQARPMFERRWPGDYDHLARVNEWRLAAEVTL